MARKLSRRFNGPFSLWWVTAGAILIFSICSGAAILVRAFYTAQTDSALPVVPTFEYLSPTVSVPPILQSDLTASTPVPSLATPTPQPSITPLPFSTPTNSFLSSLFPNIFSNQNNAQPAVVPSKTSTPLQAVVITLTPTATTAVLPPPPPTQSIPSSVICNNILYPARPGNQWTYYVDTPKRVGNVNMKVIGVEGSQAILTVSDLNSGTAFNTTVQCDQDIVLTFPLLSAQGFINEATGGSMSVDYLAGVLAPNEAAFLSSNWALSWFSTYLAYGSGSINYNGTDFNFQVSPSQMTMTCQTLAAGDAAFETITVAAGTFKALKVVCTGQGQALAVVNGSEVTGQVTAQSTQWFAPGTGLLRLQSDYVYLTVFGISIPLNASGLNGYVELTNYFIAPP